MIKFGVCRSKGCKATGYQTLRLIQTQVNSNSSRLVRVGQGVSKFQEASSILWVVLSCQSFLISYHTEGLVKTEVTRTVSIFREIPFIEQQKQLVIELIMSTSIENDTKQSSCMLNFMYPEHENLLKVAICFYTSKNSIQNCTINRM